MRKRTGRNERKKKIKEKYRNKIKETTGKEGKVKERRGDNSETKKNRKVMERKVTYKGKTTQRCKKLM